MTIVRPAALVVTWSGYITGTGSARVTGPGMVGRSMASLSSGIGKPGYTRGQDGSFWLVESETGEVFVLPFECSGPLAICWVCFRTTGEGHRVALRPFSKDLYVLCFLVLPYV